MTRLHRIGVLTLCAVMAAGIIIPPFLNGAPPVPARAAAASSGREPQAILQDMKSADEQLRASMPSLMALADPAFRKGDGQKALVPLKKMVGYMGELEKIAPAEDVRESIRMNRFRAMGFVGTLGDKETLTTLESLSKGDAKSPEARSAKVSLALVNWLTASTDPAAQAKVLDDVAAIAKGVPESEELAGTLSFMANVGAANNDVTKKVIEVIRSNLKGDEIKSMLAQLDAVQNQLELVGKPLTVQGRTTTGATFSSDSLKGKVVLLDFWATWCGPCIAELPSLKKTYEELHDKGFEIVGINYDTNDDVVNSFVRENAMPWVQLRETSQSEEDRIHPIGKRYSVEGIPTLFLIDRKGVVRHIDARQNLEQKVKSLLAEGEPAGAAAEGATTKPAAQK